MGDVRTVYGGLRTCIEPTQQADPGDEEHEGGSREEDAEREI